MTYAVTILAAACCVLGFLLVCALVGGSDQRDELQAKVEHRDARIEDLENECDRLQAQVVGLSEMNTSKAAEIRRLKIGASNHPAGKGLREGQRLASQRDDLIAHGVNPADLVVPLAPIDTDNVVALREALTERDAEHEGGEGA